jgi:CRP/FNR family cyclic AMP-dependent transcriptional regulator
MLKGYDEAAKDAIDAGFLGTLPVEAAARLLDEAVRLDIPAGSVIYRDEEDPRSIVVVGGLLRVFMRAPDGRQVTVRYARPGDICGLALTIGGPAPLSMQAVTDATVAALHLDTIRQLLRDNVEVASAVAGELTNQLYEALDEVAGNAFLSVRQRIARHLLDLATERQAGHRLVAHISQQELADAVASVRTVVSRTLQEMRREGLIETSRDEIVVLDARRLDIGRPATVDRRR